MARLSGMLVQTCEHPPLFVEQSIELLAHVGMKSTGEQTKQTVSDIEGNNGERY